MRLIGRTRFDECKHPGRASLVGSRAANYRALFWLPDAFEPLPTFLTTRGRVKLTAMPANPLPSVNISVSQRE